MLNRRRRRSSPPPNENQTELERLMELSARLHTGLDRLRKWEDEDAVAELRRKERGG